MVELPEGMEALIAWLGHRQPLIGHLHERLKRKQELPLRLVARQALLYGWGLTLGRWRLRRCTSVGARPRTRGKPYVENFGQIRIGDDFFVNSQFVQSHLYAGPGATLEIGDSVSVNFGTGISADRSIRIGNRVRIGPYGMILDTDYHAARDHDAETPALPVEIGDDVWLALRVTVLRGSSIGAGSVITAGSVVVGRIPEGVIAGGNPARVIRSLKTGAQPTVFDLHPSGTSVASAPPAGRRALRPIAELETDLVERVREITQHELGLARPPSLSVAPGSLPAWDSLGHLRLLTAVEQAFGFVFTDEAVADIDSLGKLAQNVDAQLPEARRSSSRSLPTPADLLCPVHVALERAATRVPDRVALQIEERSTSYAQLLAGSRSVAAALAGAGVAGGDSVLLLAGRKDDYLVGYYGALGAGAVVVPAGEIIGLEQIVEIAQRVKPRALLVGELERRRLALDLDTFEGVPVMALDRARATPASGWPRPVELDALAQIMFTSGTTARRKGVQLTHRNLMQASQNIALFMGMHSGMREYITVPLTHSFGLGRARTLLSLGGTVLASDGPFSPQKMAQVVAERHVNALSAVPAGIIMAMDSAERSLSPLVGQIRLIELGSAHMPVSQKERLLQFFPNARICMHYGLTEASRSTFLDFDADRLRLTSVGKASPNVLVEIRDPEGQPLPVGKSGEVVVRGGHVTPGYLGDPELTARAVTERGIRTGDLAWMDEQGYVHLKGRLDDQINVGGIKVSPSELEEPLRAAYPDLELCVLGVPDPQMLLGEVPVVVYSRRPGSELDLARVRASLAGHLDPRKLPLRVVAVDAIPKTQNGKIQRAVLRRALETTDIETPPAPTR